jgi:hypothetical protein
VKLFHHHLVGCGICSIESVQSPASTPALVTAFCDWFRTHRGVKDPTLRQYARGATDLLQTLGEDVGQWSAKAVRDFLLERASQCGTPTTQALITSLRAFLRFLSFRGESAHPAWPTLLIRNGPPPRVVLPAHPAVYRFLSPGGNRAGRPVCGTKPTVTRSVGKASAPTNGRRYVVPSFMVLVFLS